MDRTIPQLTTISNEEFLVGVFREYFKWAHVTGFTEPPDKLPELNLQHYWGGDVWERGALESPDFNNFVTISTFNTDADGSHRRRKNNFAAAYCMMLDDIGTGQGAKISPADMIAYPPPSWKLETSPDNFQWGYIFDTPILDRGQIESLLKGFVGLGLVDGGSDPGMLGCTRYMRLPLGSNTKTKLAAPFAHRLHTWRPERLYKLSDLADGFGVTLQEIGSESDDYGTPQPLEDDIIHQSLTRLSLIKSKLRDNVYDITCPWQHQHTGEMNNGTAYLAPHGFKCHHGHCESRTFRDLMGWLRGKDPAYKEACIKFMPFEPIPQADAEVAPEQSDIDFQNSINAALHTIINGELGTSKPALKLLAIQYLKLTKEEREHYTLKIKDATGYTIKLTRDMVAEARASLLEEHRKNGILNEPAWKDFRDENIVGTLANFRAICEFHGITMRFNQMAHSLDIDIPKDEFSDEDIDNLNLTHMRDLMMEYGLVFTRTGEWMNAYAHEDAYHPFQDYLNRIENLPFDPTLPMFNKLMSTLSITEFPEQAEVFVRRWFISVVAAVRGHGGAGMKGVLTFTGGQGIGKTSWFREIFPADMFCEGLVLDAHNKDTMIQATNHLVCELGELDATFKRDIPALKAFISNQSDKIRHPYAAKSSIHPRRTVFCATVNQSDFLVDQTGNSRFWPVAVDNCDWSAVAEMKRLGQIDMLWREFDSMYQACRLGRTEFKWWLGIEDMGLLNEVSEQFIRESPGESLLKEQYEMEAPAVHWISTADLMTSLGFHFKDNAYGARKSEVISALKRITGQRLAKPFRKDGEVVKGYKVPQRKSRKMAAQLGLVPTVPVGEGFDFL